MADREEEGGREAAGNFALDLLPRVEFCLLTAAMFLSHTYVDVVGLFLAFRDGTSFRNRTRALSDGPMGASLCRSDRTVWISPRQSRIFVPGSTALNRPVQPVQDLAFLFAHHRSGSLLASHGRLSERLAIIPHEQKTAAHLHFRMAAELGEFNSKKRIKVADVKDQKKLIEMQEKVCAEQAGLPRRCFSFC
jgi:hypothetical protein